MTTQEKDTLAIATVSAISGSRATLGPALVWPKNQVLTYMAAGELYVDKLPGVGDRIAPSGLIGRSISGAITGAAVSKKRRRNPWAGALLGAATAFAATYVTWYARKQLVKYTKLPDPLIALLEDVTMLCIGNAIMGNEE
jgi:uncharacterized membrane protein